MSTLSYKIRQFLREQDDYVSIQQIYKAVGATEEHCTDRQDLRKRQQQVVHSVQVMKSRGIITKIGANRYDSRYKLGREPEYEKGVSKPKPIRIKRDRPPKPKKKPELKPKKQPKKSGLKARMNRDIEVIAAKLESRQEVKSERRFTGNPQKDREILMEDYEAWLAAGNKPEILPMGASSGNGHKLY